MDSKLEQNIFFIISNSGEAKSTCISAIALAKTGKIEEAKIKLLEAKTYHQAAQEWHLKLIEKESQDISNNLGSSISLLMAHAEDQMMSVEIIRILSSEIIDIYEKIK